MFLDLPPGYTYPDIAIGYKAGPSPHEVHLTEHANLEAEQAEPAEPEPQSLSLTTMGTEPVCQEVQSPTMAAQVEAQREKVQRGKMVTEVEEETEEEHKEVTHTPVSPCPVSNSSLDEPQTDTANIFSRDCVREAHAPAVDVKLQEEGIVSPPQDATITSQELQSIDPPKDNQDRTPNEGCVSPIHSADLQEITQSSPLSSPLSEPLSLGNQYSGSCIWSLELLIAAALCATRDAHMASSVSVPAPVVPLHQGMELLSELADLERRQQKMSTSKESEGA